MTSFTYDGKDYTLKLTRAGVRAAEEAGLKVSTMQDSPFSSLAHLFFAALHPYRVTPNKATGMLDELLDDGTFTVEGLFEELVEAYTALFGSGESEKPKK